MNMTPKENMLAVLNHQSPEWVPNYLTDVVNGGFGFGPGPAFEKGPVTGGRDGFGVNWVTPSSGGGAPIPEPDSFLLNSETIVDWKKIVKFPDIMECDWEAQAKMELGRGNPETQLIDFGSGNGPFERLAALMGFEEALVSMAVEPEATGDLLNAIGEYKIQVIEMAAKYYQPDVFTNYDDIATERSLFMAPDTYRRLIKPVHKKIYEAVRAFDMIPIQHTCGKADILIEDFIETGAAGWTSVQPTNDIESILKKHGDSFCILGGYATNGPAGRPDADPSVIEAEVQRDFDTYGKYPGYIWFGFLLIDTLDPDEKIQKMMPLIKASMKYGKHF